MSRSDWFAPARGRLLGLLPLPLLVALIFGVAQDVTSGWIHQEPREAMRASADSLQSEFLRANRLLAEGRPADALEIYGSLLDADSGLQSGAVHYNAGLAAQAMNRLGSAKAHYLGASAFPETREQAFAAIAQVDQLLPFNMARIPRYPWQKAYDALTDSVGAQALSVAASFGLYVACIGAVLLLFTSMRKTGRWLGFAGLGLFAAAISVVLTLERELDRQGTAVVVRANVTLVDDPGTGLETTQLAYEGAVARLDLRRSDAHPGWFHATLQNGSSGWLRREHLQRVYHPSAQAEPVSKADSGAPSADPTSTGASADSDTSTDPAPASSPGATPTSTP